MKRDFVQKLQAEFDAESSSVTNQVGAKTINCIIWAISITSLIKIINRISIVGYGIEL